MGSFHKPADKAAHHRRQRTAGMRANPTRIATIADPIDPWAAFRKPKPSPIPFRLARG